MSLKLEMKEYNDGWYSSWGDYDDDDYRSDRCDCSECNDYWGGQCEYEGTWGYLNTIDDDVKNTQKIVNTGRYWRRIVNQTLVGRMIDMDSIYSREKLREKKINQILGLEKPTYISRPTIGDFFPK